MRPAHATTLMSSVFQQQIHLSLVISRTNRHTYPCTWNCKPQAWAWEAPKKVCPSLS